MKPRHEHDMNPSRVDTTRTEIDPRYEIDTKFDSRYEIDLKIDMKLTRKKKEKEKEGLCLGSTGPNRTRPIFSVSISGDPKSTRPLFFPTRTREIRDVLPPLGYCILSHAFSLLFKELHPYSLNNPKKLLSDRDPVQCAGF